MTASPHETGPQRQQAADLALHAHGTAWIFEKRAQKYAKLLRGLAFLGLVVPVTIGALVAAFGVKFAALEVVLVIGGLVVALQVVWSLWALVAKWDDALTSSWESQVDNNRLFKRFQELASAPAAVTADEFERRMALLRVENDAREAQDTRREITEAEKRGGMRAGLRQAQRACVACGKIPVSMNPDKCHVCGNF